MCFSIDKLQLHRLPKVAPQAPPFPVRLARECRIREPRSHLHIESGEEHCPPSFAVSHARPQRRRRRHQLLRREPGSCDDGVSTARIRFHLDDAEGDVSEQR